MTSRIVCTIRVVRRLLHLVVDETGHVGCWYENNALLGQASVLETELGLLLEQARGKICKIECALGCKQYDCFDCADRTCENFWGPSRAPEQEQEESKMPPKKDVKAAIRKGVNPYAVAQAAVNKGKIPASKKEAVVKGVTKSTLHKGKKKSGKCK